MPKFDIAVIATVVASSIDEARQLVYARVEDLNDGGHTEFSIADDSMTEGHNLRVVLLHPEDTHANYNSTEYNANLEKNEE